MVGFCLFVYCCLLFGVTQSGAKDLLPALHSRINFGRAIMGHVWLGHQAQVSYLPGKCHTHYTIILTSIPITLFLKCPHNYVLTVFLFSIFHGSYFLGDDCICMRFLSKNELLFTELCLGEYNSNSK